CALTHLCHSVCPRSPIFFAFLIPLPPRSTLFPYTTLFRSTRLLQAVNSILDRKSVKEVYLPFSVRVLTMELTTLAPTLRTAPMPDRKSTRLNSSHVSISYAVFCLKKKNTY